MAARKCCSASFSFQLPRFQADDAQVVVSVGVMGRDGDRARARAGTRAEPQYDVRISDTVFDSWTAYSTELRDHDSKPVAHFRESRGVTPRENHLRVLICPNRGPCVRYSDNVFRLRARIVRSLTGGSVIANALGAAVALLAD